MNTLPLDDGSTVIVAMTVELDSPKYQHLEIWQESNAMSPDRYKIVSENFRGQMDHTSFEMHYRGNMVLLVKDQEALKEFNDWWSHYSDRFDGMEHEDYLPTPKNNFISGYMVQHLHTGSPVITMPHPKKLKKDWIFIINNCPGKVYWTITHWIFEDQNDAVMYKLKKEKNNLDMVI
jgi:hypothetical protein